MLLFEVVVGYTDGVVGQKPPLSPQSTISQPQSDDRQRCVSPVEDSVFDNSAVGNDSQATALTEPDVERPRVPAIAVHPAPARPPRQKTREEARQVCLPRPSPFPNKY